MAATPQDTSAAGAPKRRRLFHYNLGFLRDRRLRRILALAGYDLTFRGTPGPEDAVAVWGHSPYAPRGEKVARRTGAQLIRLEDAFLRSLHPGRAGGPTIGLMIDRLGGAHFAPDAPSELETILAEDPLDNAAELAMARAAMERMRDSHLSKYSATEPEAPCPEPGYVLVVDQTRGDASVTTSGADANSFREMLYYAQEDNPGARIVIKTHPETRAGHRQGYFSQADASETITVLDSPVSPYALLEGAVAVYTVSSQLGFEAIVMGHRPNVFGRPIYAGWGLSEDRAALPLPRRGRSLTRAQLFAGAMIKAPTWYDPCTDRLCDLETALGSLEAETRAWREDHRGWQAGGMRLWKRRPLRQFFGQHGRLRFTDSPKGDAPAMVWAAHAREGDTRHRLEDGFLRSRGLGAELTPPLSLVLDDLGIYYDPTRPSRLERLILKRAEQSEPRRARARALIEAIRATGVTKYNLEGTLPDLPSGHRILVPGQVEDDASIRLGAGDVNTNLALLNAARAANPGAVILYKPHPDVEAGLRPGAVPQEALTGLADVLVEHASADALLGAVEEVWTMTSLMGFEALLRGLRVTVTGAPFYAGWGLTHDKGRLPARRGRHVSLEALVHAALIDYPRYHDPVSKRPCTPELAIARLAAGTDLPRSPSIRALAKLQGVFASYAHLWR